MLLVTESGESPAYGKRHSNPGAGFWWSWWVPSNSRYSMILSAQERIIPTPEALTSSAGGCKGNIISFCSLEKMNLHRKIPEEAQVESNLLNNLLVQIWEGLFAFCLSIAEVLLNWDPGLLTQKCWLAPYLNFPICRMSNILFTSDSYLHQVSH